MTSMREKIAEIIRLHTTDAAARVLAQLAEALRNG